MKLSKREKFISILTFAVVILWVFNTFFYTPKKQALAKVQAEIKAIDDGMTQMVMLRAESAQLEKELKAIQERLHAFRGKLSGKKSFSAFLRSLSFETSRLNIRIISLLPKEDSLESDESMKSYTIETELIGNYRTFTLLLERLKEMPVLILVDQFQIEKGEKEPSELTINLRLRTYTTRGKNI